MKYDYKAVEAKWQKTWEDEKTFHVEIDHSKPKFYALVELSLIHIYSTPSLCQRLPY